MAPSAQERPATDRPEAPPDPDRRSAEHLTVSQARDLLDWLEAHKIPTTEVLVEADGTMTVRWKA